MYEYFEYPAVHCAGKMRGVRTDRWKLIHYIQEPQEFELFDLENDPQEMNNLYGRAEHNSRVAELRAELERWRDVTGDDRSEDGTPALACGNRMRDE
jgi:arylsulfatase A-like enzyme